MTGELYGISCAAAWALTSLAMKHLSTQMNAAVINGLRCGVSFLFFLAVLAVLGGGSQLVHMPPVAAVLLLLSGFIGVGVGDVFYIWSMRLIGAARTMPIAGAYPLLVLFIAAPFLGEQITLAIVVGTVLVLGGVTLLAIPPGLGLRSMGALLVGAERRGLLLALLTAVTWTTSAMMLKIGLQEIDPIVSNILRLAAASVSLLAIAGVVERGSLDLRKIDSRAFAWLLFVTAFGTVATYAFVLAVQLAGAGKATVLSATAPLFALPFAVRMGERVTLRVVAGTVVTVAGITLLVA